MKCAIHLLLCTMLLSGCISGRGTKKRTCERISQPEQTTETDDNGLEIEIPVPKSKQELLAVGDTASNFLFSDDEELQSSNIHVYWLMNRMMQMSIEACDCESDWAWMYAMNDCIADYSVCIGRKISPREAENLAMKDIETFINPYCEGTQSEINTWTYVMATLSEYRTLNIYGRLIETEHNRKVKNLLQNEYRAWHRVNSALDNFMHNHTYPGYVYSALPMDINGTFGYFAYERYKELLVEWEILRHSSLECNAICFEEFDNMMYSDSDMNEPTLSNISPYRCIDEVFRDDNGNATASSAENEEIRSAIAEWLVVRERLADVLPIDKQTAYRKMTRRVFHRFINDLDKLTK